MSIPITCSSCGESLQAADRLAGKTLACPKCETILSVPGVAASEAVSAEKPGPSPRYDDRGPAPKSSSKTIWIVLGIVIAVLFLVTCLGIALLVPAVAKVREAANRLQTNINLKNCSLAVHMFHDTNRRFPDAFGPSPKFGKNTSLWFELLPFIEQANVYQQGEINAIVPPFLAPADPYIVPDQSRGQLSFAANIRLFGYDTLLNNKQPVNEPGKAVGVPAGKVVSGLTLGKIAGADGMTNTIMLTTRYANCAGQKTWYAADVTGNCELGKLPAPGAGGFMGAGSHDTPPTKTGPLTAMFQATPTEAGCLPQPAIFGHSFGAGGMSAALCDGSVRTIRPDMSPLTFTRALCPADGQKLGPDWADD